VRIHHVALRVLDLERSIAFYSKLLGLPVMRRNTEKGRLRSVWLAAGDSVVMLERVLAGVGPDSGSAHLLALQVDDLEAWERRLSNAGVALDGRTQWSLYFRDPDGHRVGVSRFAFPAAKPR
jgi:catechol 2,3-dioxygenase-like lactoylglutathione lyase family enzyme